ncbi:hypothetical protein PMAYCL1PPCAC_05730, partial [Pristionchus mayeri]
LLQCSLASSSSSPFSPSLSLASEEEDPSAALPPPRPVEERLPAAEDLPASSARTPRSEAAEDTPRLPRSRLSEETRTPANKSRPSFKDTNDNSRLVVPVFIDGLQNDKLIAL